MTLRKLIRIVFLLLLVLAVAVGLTSINHPIIWKWVTGSARHHGRPMPAAVYANGQVNERIQVFYTDEANSYLVSLSDYDRLERLRFLHVDLNEKWVGTPVASSKNDYDLIAGHLFQSETGARFTRFEDPEKGFRFDPQLRFSGGRISFNLPPNKEKLDSLRIELP